MLFSGQTTPNSSSERKSSKLFLQIMLSVLFLLLLSTIVITIVLRPLLREQEEKIAEQAFQKAETDIVMLTKTARTIGVQILLDDMVAPLLNAIDATALKIDVVNAGVSQLALLQNTNDLIHSIYIINRGTGFIFSTNQRQAAIDSASFQDSQILEWIDAEDHAYRLKKRSGVLNSRSSKVSSEVYTYVLPNRYDENILSSAIVINISLTRLASQIADYPEFQDNTYIYIADDHDLLVEANSIPGVETEQFRAWAEETLSADIAIDSRALDAEAYSLIRHTSLATQVQFVMIRPHDQVYGALLHVQNVFLKIMGCIAFLGIVVSFSISQRIRRFFSAVDQEHRRNLMSQDPVRLRENFWKDFLESSAPYPQEDLVQSLKRHNLTGSEKGYLAMLCLEHENDIDSIESTLLKELLEEELAPLRPMVLFRCSTSWAVLFHPDDPKTFQRLPDLLVLVANRSEVSFNLVYARQLISIQQYPIVWTSLNLAKRLVFFYPEKTSLDCECILNEHQNTANQSNIRVAQQIGDNICRGNLEVAVDILSAFEQTLQDMTFDSYFNHMIWLAMSLTNIIAPMFSDEKASRNAWSFENFILSMHRCTRRPQMLNLFWQYLNHFVDTAKASGTSKSVPARVEAIRRYIQKNYSSQTLSPNSIAENFALSPDYLRKTFKAGSGQSLTDYISLVRLQAATEQLINTNYTLQKISDCCGFASVNYFCTCFKKKYGVTPSQYRSSSSAQE